MKKVLIIDDEMYIVDGLANYLQKIKSLDLDVYRAYSAYEALALLNASNFDIIVSDIKMPGMDGITLMEVVKSRWPFCRFIFLTGYDEFEYIHKAMKNDCSGYILKSEGYTEIENVLTKAVQEIDTLFMKERYLESNKANVEKTLTVFRNEFFRDLICGNLCKLEVEQAVDELLLPLKLGKPLMLMTARINKKPDNESRLGVAKRNTEFLNLSENFFKQTFYVFQAEIEDDCIAWILQAVEEEPEVESENKKFYSKILDFLNRCAEGLQNSVYERMGIDISIFVDASNLLWESLPERFKKQKELLETNKNPDAQLLIRGGLDAEKILQSDEHALFERVDAYIAENLTSMLTLVKVADAVHYNPAYLSRVFKAKYGVNLFDYINNLRLKKATELLKSTDEKIYTVAELSGFSSAAYFYYFFKKTVGMTPQEYRDSR